MKRVNDMKDEKCLFDVIIVTTAADYRRVRCNVQRIFDLVPAEHFYFVGSAEVGELVEEGKFGKRIGFIDENSLIPFDDVHKVVKEILNTQDVPRGVTGWYYQQFLKMKYSEVSKHNYYMTWDGDTVPCKEFSMFSAESGQPYFDVKTEYHEEYFTTLSNIFPGMKKVIGKSFISEHMLFNRDVMKKMIEEIESDDRLTGTSFYEKILKAVRFGELRSNSFSEFETYGTYVAYRYRDMYKLRNWHSIRYGSMYFIPGDMTDADYRWLGSDFDAVSYEKNQEFVPEISKYFMSPEYRTKLSPRYIIETIQDFSSEGMKEEWDTRAKKVSVVISTYNDAQHIRECLDGILFQNYPRDCMELIIVDDCSDDGTRDILSQYEAMFPEQIMLVLLDEHAGSSETCREIGLQYASGEYVTYANADKAMDKNYISQLVAKAQGEECGT